MQSNEFDNLTEIFNLLENDLENFIRSKYTREAIKTLSLEELEVLKEKIDKIRFGSSTIYAASLGVSNRIYEEIDKKRGKVITPIEPEEPKAVKVVVQTKTKAPVDLEAMAKMIATMNLSKDDLTKIKGES